MTAVYHRHKIRFQYPSNWELTDDSPVSASDPNVRLTLESPGGAMWSLYAWPTRDLDGAIEQAWDALREEYGQLELHAAEPLWGDQPPGVSQEAEFLYLDLVIRAQAHALAFDGGTLLILVQADAQEFENLEPVFGAIAASLIRELQAWRAP